MNIIISIITSHPIIFSYLGIINIITLFFFGTDKLFAQSNSWRIRERTLLLLSLAGGSIGAIIGMNIFRHKIRKDIFLFWFALIIALQLLVLYYVVGVYTRPISGSVDGIY